MFSNSILGYIHVSCHLPSSGKQRPKFMIHYKNGKKAGQAATWHILVWLVPTEGSDWLQQESALRVCMVWPFSRASICSWVKLVLFLCSFLLSCSLSWDSSPSSLSTGTPPPLPPPPPPASPPILPSVSSRQPSDTGGEGGDKRDGWMSRKLAWYNRAPHFRTTECKVQWNNRQVRKSAKHNITRVWSWWHTRT